MSKLAQIDEYAARLLMISLFLPARIQVLVVIAMCAYFVFRTIAIRSFPPAANYLWAFAIGGAYLLYVFALPLTPHAYHRVASALCERKVSLLLLPLIFAFIAPVYRRIIAGEIIYFVYACIIATTLANADYFYHYFFVHGGLHELSHVTYRVIFESFSGVHPTYMGIYLSFSICIILLSAPPTGKGERIVRYSILYALLLFLLSLLAKSPIIALIFIGLHYMYRHRKTLAQFKTTFAGLAAMLAAVYLFIPFFRQRVAEMFGIGNAGLEGNITNNSVHVRKLIFNTDFDVIKHYWLTGVGPGRTLSYLNMRYFFFSIANGYTVGYFDPHNEYFFEWISFGIMGLAVFLAMLAMHFVRAIRAKNDLYLYLLIILGITFFTETLLSRQQGVLFYAVFTSLMFFLPFKEKKDLKEVSD